MSQRNFVYYAPEMVNLQELPGFLNVKTDVFGLGMIFFELVFSMFGFVELDQKCREHNAFKVPIIEVNVQGGNALWLSRIKM